MEADFDLVSPGKGGGKLPTSATFNDYELTRNSKRWFRSCIAFAFFDWLVQSEILVSSELKFIAELVFDMSNTDAAPYLEGLSRLEGLSDADRTRIDGLASLCRERDSNRAH